MVPPFYPPGFSIIVLLGVELDILYMLESLVPTETQTLHLWIRGKTSPQFIRSDMVPQKEAKSKGRRCPLVAILSTRE